MRTLLIAGNWKMNPPSRLEAIALAESVKVGVGSVADVVVIDVANEWRVYAAGLKSKSKNTPFDEWKLTGHAKATVLGGRAVFGM